MRRSWLYFATRSVRDAEPVLIWPAPVRHGEVGDEGVFRLARAVRDDRQIARRARHLDRLERLGQRADLVHLDEDRVRRRRSRCRAPGARCSSRRCRRRRAGSGRRCRSVSSFQPSQSSSASPSSMETIGILVDPLLVELHHLPGVERLARAALLEGVLAVLVELTRRADRARARSPGPACSPPPRWPRARR